MTADIVDELNRILFYLNTRNNTEAFLICSKALSIAKKVPKPEKPSEEYRSILNSLKSSIESLRKCSSSSQHGDTRACVDIARDVYRYALLLDMVSTSRIRRLVKARRSAYTAIALGLPTAALFGLSPVAIALVFLGVLWTYPYFVRLKLVGWVTVVAVLLALMPFTINAVSYFSQAVFSQSEIANISRELGVSAGTAFAIALVLLAIAASSLALAVYAFYCLARYRAAFR